MDWQWPVLADDDGSAMTGTAGRPPTDLVDGDARVRQLSGEVPIAVLDPLVDD